MPSSCVPVGLLNLLNHSASLSLPVKWVQYSAYLGGLLGWRELNELRWVKWLEQFLAIVNLQ